MTSIMLGSGAWLALWITGQMPAVFSDPFGRIVMLIFLVCFAAVVVHLVSLTWCYSSRKVHLYVSLRECRRTFRRLPEDEKAALLYFVNRGSKTLPIPQDEVMWKLVHTDLLTIITERADGVVCRIDEGMWRLLKRDVKKILRTQ